MLNQVKITRPMHMTPVGSAGCEVFPEDMPLYGSLIKETSRWRRLGVNNENVAVRREMPMEECG